jgi:hypothetical protein
MRNFNVFIPVGKESFWRWLKEWIRATNEDGTPRPGPYNIDYYKLQDPPYLDIVQGLPPYIFEVWRYRTTLVSNRPQSMSFEMFGNQIDGRTHRRTPDDRKLALRIILTEADGGSFLVIECDAWRGVQLEDVVLALEELGTVSPVDLLGGIAEGESATEKGSVPPKRETNGDNGHVERQIVQRQPNRDVGQPFLKANLWLIEQYFGHGQTKYAYLREEWLKRRKDENPSLPIPQDPIASMRKVIRSERKRRKEGQ